MRDTRLLQAVRHIEAALEVLSELADEGIDNVAEAARLDMVGRRLVEGRAGVLSVYEVEAS